MLGLESDAKRLLYHHLHLLLRGSAISADGDLRLAGSILRDSDASLRGSDDGSALGASQLEDNLRIFPEEWRLDGHVIRMVHGNELGYTTVNICEFLKRIAYLTQVKDSHGNIMRSTGIYTNDPVTKDVGSGVNTQYDSIFSQSCRIQCKDGEPQE